MSTIILKAIELPKEEVIELSQLTHIGLMDLKYQAERLIEEIQELIDKGGEEWLENQYY